MEAKACSVVGTRAPGAARTSVSHHSSSQHLRQIVELTDEHHVLNFITQRWGEASTKVPSPTLARRLIALAWGSGWSQAKQLRWALGNPGGQGTGPQYIESPLPW